MLYYYFFISLHANWNNGQKTISSFMSAGNTTPTAAQGALRAASLRTELMEATRNYHLS
jgi:hypothetical protein